MEALKKRKKVQVLVTYKDEILLFKLSPERGGFWQNITGGVDAGEDFLSAAYRELWEETGLKRNDLAFNLVDLNCDFRFIDQYQNDVVEKVFWADLIETNQAPSVQLSNEHTEFKHFKLHTFDTTLYRFKSNADAFVKMFQIKQAR